MKKFFVTAIAAVLFVCADAARKPVPQLAFDSSKGVAGSVEMPTEQTVHYTAYTKLYYVTNVEDTTYQYMNVYVTDGATQQSPIFFKNNIGGYMPSAPGAISAGGAMSALLGASGNNPDYEPLLEKMGAAKERDDIFTAVCFCPISDLSHADMAYEWLYGNTDSRKANDAAHREVTKELAAQFPAYINSLGLKLDDGTQLTSDNYLDFIKKEIIRAAQLAKDVGAEIPDSIGFTFSSEGGTFAPLNGGQIPADMAKNLAKLPQMPKRVGEYITDLDMPSYLNYVANKTALKSAPAFDALGVAGDEASGENDEFGDAQNNPANFTEYSAAKNGKALSEEVKKNEKK